MYSTQNDDQTDSGSAESRKRGHDQKQPRFVKYDLHGVDTKVIILNASRSQYTVLEEIARQLGWVFEKEPKSETWDVCWTDSEIGPDQLFRMHDYQKISHFPGINTLARKNTLGKGLMKMRKAFPSEYNFFPLTWSLPFEFNQLSLYVNNLQQKQNCIFIVKPEASCQGKGIFLTKSISELQGQTYVVQRYLQSPLLINKLKFDFRMYVLLVGCDPLRAYIYNEGLARFATEPYKSPKQKNLKSACVHLTNYSVNKKNPNFVFNESDTRMDVGHKRSLSSIMTYLEKTGVDVEKLKERINDLVAKTLISAQPILSHMYRLSQPNNFGNDMCFHILGFDVILDEKMDPYLLEVNHNPSLVTDTPLDKFIKKKLVKDTLNLLNIDTKSKENKVGAKLSKILSKQSGTRVPKPNYNEKQELRRQCQTERDAYQEERIGGFTRILPSKNSQTNNQYRNLLEGSFKIFKQVSGIKRDGHCGDSSLEEKVRRAPSNKKNGSPGKSVSTKSAQRPSKIPAQPSMNQSVCSQFQTKRVIKYSNSLDCRYRLPQIQRQRGKFVTPHLFYLNDWQIPHIKGSVILGNFTGKLQQEARRLGRNAQSPWNR